MTTLFPQSITCALCGATNEVVAVGSTNQFGSMDLDLRPPPMMRDILDTQVQRCVSCGLCCSDLAQVNGLAVDLVGSPAYAALLKDPMFPVLAKSFRAHSMLAEAGGELKAAVSAQLRAAWACDDSTGDAGAAEACRRETLRQLSLLHDQAGTFCDDRATDMILELDLLRRSRQFELAEELASTLSNEELPDVLARIAVFQGQRAQDRDLDCYTVETALQD